MEITPFNPVNFSSAKPVEIVFCETLEDVVDAAADLLFESQNTAIKERGVFRIALCGGRASLILYERLASEEWRNDMQWEQWEVFWAEEGAVLPDHPDSNFGTAHSTLLNRVPVGEIWRMRGEAEDLPSAAEEYARTIKNRFGPGTPAFDTILLEMGEDGRIASLFPGSPALESSALVEAVEGGNPCARYLTFTLRLLNSARQVILLATGQEKSEAVREALEKSNGSYPAARIELREGTCWWLLDKAASVSPPFSKKMDG